MSEINTEILLINNKVRFRAISKEHPELPLVFDYLPPLGDDEGLLGLEGLVMSFGGCVSTAIVGLLRRMKKTILSYKVDLAGIKGDEPLSLEKIIFDITLESPDVTDADIQKVIETAKAISPVWLAIKNNVEVLIKYSIN